MNQNLQGRPKPKFGVSDDIEDEMLQYQELFRRSNMEPSAKVIREPQLKRQQSNDVESRAKKIPPIDMTQTTVMRPIIMERDVSSMPIQLPKPVQESFPQATHRGTDDLDNLQLPNVKKVSLFAKQIYRDGQLKKCRELEEKNSTSGSTDLSKSALLTGEGLGDMNAEREIERIHRENTDRLKTLDESDILAEKEKLLNSLDPKLISFIRQRHKKDKVNIETELARSNSEPMEIAPESNITPNDLPFEIDSRWMHMDQIEHEKLQWMKSLSTPSVHHKTTDSNSEGVPARFDFKGMVISPTEDIPVTAALHHHGENPEAAGYTLDELFHLCRSAVLQQRMISFQTLSNIIRQAHKGTYDLVLQLPLIPKLLEAGILFLIRWAMDEQIESVYMIAIDCLANLIAPQNDEKVLSETMHWPCGYFQPLLTPPELELSEKKTESDLTDIEIVEQDVIKCLFRMNILKRTVYLLDRMRSLPKATIIPTVNSLFYILIRMARHSMNCANQIFSDRQLMDFIVREFIPEIALSTETKNLHGNLLPVALKLCRVLAASGTSLASNLITQYNLDQRLQNHLAAVISVSSLEDNETLIEILALWRVFILQGQLVIDFGSLIPVFILPLCRSCIQRMPNTNVSHILVQLLTVIDALIIHVTKFISQNRNTQQITETINWSHLDGLFDILLTIGKQTLIRTDENIDLNRLRTACLSCLSSFLIGQQTLKINLMDLPTKVHVVNTQLLKPILQLKSIKHLVNNVTFESAEFSTNSCRNLPSMTQKQISPFGLLISLIRLTKIGYRINKTDATKERFITNLMLDKNSEILVYIKKILNRFTSIDSRRIPWFEHFEHVFIFEFIQVIYEEKLDDDTFPSIYYEILLCMLPSLLLNSHYLAQEILRFLFFDGSFWKRSNDIDLNDLSLISTDSLCLASKESISFSSNQRNNLYQRAVEHLPSLFTYYQHILRLNRPSIEFNHCDIHFGNFFHSEESIKLIIHYSNSLIDPTWPYGVLSSLYTNIVRIEDLNQKLDVVLNTLRFVYILENKKSLNLMKQLTKITRFSMIAGIYLLGHDIFLEKQVAEYLVAFLNSFNEQNLLRKLEINKVIQSLMTFHDFYQLLVDQYDACSFGDVLFSNYILIPLQQIYGVQLRKNLWIEHSTSLNALRLKSDQIVYSIESFFIPYENDIEMIRFYAQILFNETIKKSIQPLITMIAVHHLNAFLFDQTRSDQISFQKSLMKRIKSNSTKEKNSLEDILNYKTFSKEGPVFFNSLPTIRANWIEKLLQK